MAKPKPSDFFEWTITDAPTESEPPPLAAPPPPASPSNEPRKRAPASALKGMWLIVGGLIIVAALGMAPSLSWYRTQYEIRRIVRGEEQAALARDVTGFTQLSEAGDAVWVQAQAWRARSGQAAPLPIPLLRPAAAAGIVQSISSFAPEIAQVDVARKFVAPDGSVLTFNLPQFYHYARGNWRRIPAPEEFWGDMREHSGEHVALTYSSADAAFADDLEPYLEGILARACETWRCPAGFNLTLNFANYDYQPEGIPPALPADDPLLFGLLPPHVTRAPKYVLHLRSPHAAGYPAEAAARDLLRRAIANQVLFAAADQLTFAEGRPSRTGNTFFYALIARMAARVGADSPTVTGIISASNAVAAERMWDSRRPEDMRPALALLNWLLQNQPEDTEARLFRGLRSASSMPGWLAEATGITQAEAQAQIRLAEAGISGGAVRPIP